MDAQAGITFLKSKLYSQITKQFNFSNQKMLDETNKTIETYPVFEMNLTPGFLPKNVWVEGKFSIGEWHEAKGEIVNTFYEVISDKTSFTLLLKEEYFLANLDILKKMGPGFLRYIQIPVKMLCKVLYPLPDIKYIIATPYLIKTNDMSNKQ